MEMEMMTMDMYFYQTKNVHFLFDAFYTENTGSYIACLICSFAMGFAVEMIGYYKFKLEGTYEKEFKTSNSFSL